MVIANWYPLVPAKEKRGSKKMADSNKNRNNGNKFWGCFEHKRPRRISSTCRRGSKRPSTLVAVALQHLLPPSPAPLCAGCSTGPAQRSAVGCCSPSPWLQLHQPGSADPPPPVESTACLRSQMCCFFAWASVVALAGGCIYSSSARRAMRSVDGRGRHERDGDEMRQIGRASCRERV